MPNDALEKAIDEAGRARVFERARTYGWAADSGAPEFVWWGIVQEVRENRPPPAAFKQPGMFDFLWR